MGGAVSWGYYAPELGPGEVHVNDLVIAPLDLAFTVITGAEAIDELSQWLAKGNFPESYDLMVRLLRALAPKGGRVLDLGAHVGMFALAAAADGYEVLAVEASPRNAAHLRESIERNGFDRLRLVHAAVSDRPGVLEFCQAGPYGHVLTGTSGESVKVPAIDVDRLLAEHGWDRVDFVKMNIEGSEVNGLRGMARLLGRADAPPLLIESNIFTLGWFQQTPARLKRRLADFGYRNYLVEDDRLRPVHPGDVQLMTCVDYLALKRRSPGVGTWLIGPPLGQEELVAQAMAMCRSPNPIDLRIIAGTLLRADPSVRFSRPIAESVEALRRDPDEQVRAAALAIPPSSPRWRWLRRWVG